MKKIIYLFLLIIFTGCSATSKKPLEPPVSRVTGERLEYSQGEDYFSGYLTYNPDKKDPRPGIILIHHWVGLDDFTMKEADKFARAGYIVFAMDMYGRDVVVDSHEEAGKLSGFYKKNRDIMRSRVQRAVEVLKENPYVDKENIAGIGYCFGGDALIDYMLYAGDFKAGISYHGFYTSPLAGEDLNGALQINHGALDNLSTMDQFTGFMAAHPEAESYIYEEAGHGFTAPGPGYNNEAAALSFERGKSFLKRKLNNQNKEEFLDYTITIDAPIEDVFSYLSDPEKNKLWIKGLIEEKSLYKKEGTYLDSRFIQKIRSFGMNMEFLGVVTSYSEPDYLEMYYSDNRFIIKLDYILEEVDEGTRLTHKAYSVDSNAFTNFFNKSILKGQVKRLKKAAEENK